MFPAIAGAAKKAAPNSTPRETRVFNIGSTPEILIGYWVIKLKAASKLMLRRRILARIGNKLHMLDDAFVNCITNPI